MPRATAARRISQPSVRAPEPVGVLTTRSTSPLSIQSTTCGEPSAILLIAVDRHAPALDRLRGAARGDDPEAEVVEQLGDRDRARLVGVGDRDEHRALARQRRARRGLGLGERASGSRARRP